MQDKQRSHDCSCFETTTGYLLKSLLHRRQLAEQCVHAGSVDEGPEEQGVAHFVEHVTFLGSRKRENLLGTGCRSNAYTDFQHTVFHVHLPLSHGTTGRPMLPQVCFAQ